MVTFLGKKSFSSDCLVAPVVLAEHVHEDDKLPHLSVGVAEDAVLEDGSFGFAGTAVVVMVVPNCFVPINVDVALVAGKTGVDDVHPFEKVDG